jgi:hypothetical protein
MKPPRAPRLEQRRAPEFMAELEERARAWIPSWGLNEGEHDFGWALLKIAARFDSEVAERLDGAGEKMRRGLLDWLAVRGQAARPARMPVVFKLADTARERVLASAPVRLQADAAGTPVIFETEDDVRMVPGRLEVVVGIDAEKDAFYLPPPGLNDLIPLDPLPSQWQLKSFAAAGATHFQLDPEAGLLPDIIIEAGDQQYRIVKADKDLVTIDRPLMNGLDGGSVVTKVTRFSPFDGKTYNQQQHALYIGDTELLNVKAAATIEVVGAKSLSTGVKWEYWGKVEDSDPVDWQPLKFADNQKPDAVVLNKLKGEIEILEIAGLKSRWIRCTTTKLEAQANPFSVDALELKVNCFNGSKVRCPPVELAPSDPVPDGPAAEAMANSTPLVLSEPFFPLGREPRLFDAFYLGSAEVFSKKGATTQVCFEMSDATSLAYATVRVGGSAKKFLAGVGRDQALHLFRLDPADGAITVFRGSLRPTQADRSEPLNLNTNCRPVMWNGSANPEDFFVAVAAGAEIWIWHENASDPKASVWERHSSIPSLPGAQPAEIQDIIVLQSDPRKPGAVLAGGRFWVFTDPVWTEFPPLRDYTALAPVYDTNIAPTNSMVAVGTDKQLYQLKTNGAETAISPGVLVDVGKIVVDNPPMIAVRPAAIQNGSQLHVVAVSNTRDKLLAVEQVGTTPGSLKQQIALAAGAEVIGAEIAVAKIAGNLEFFVGANKTSGGALVVSWIPTFVTTDPTVLFESPIPDASGDIRGTPLIVSPYIVVPGASGDAFVARFDPTQRLLPFTTKIIGEGVIVRLPAPFVTNDFISVMPKPAGPRMEWKVVNAPSDRGTETIYVVDQTQVLNKHVADKPELIGYLVSNAANELAGTIVAGSSNFKFNPTPKDPTIQVGDILRVAEKTGTTLGTAIFCQVKANNGNGSEIEVQSGNALPGTSGVIAYWKPKTVDARTVPAIEFNPSGDGNWDASILERARVYFPSAPAGQLQPSSQQAIAFGVVNNHPTVVALKQPWTTTQLPSLTAPTEFIIDDVIGDWMHQLDDSLSNPALSWEYWNGTGWWSLEIVKDGTDRLASTGAIEFIVPTDIAESDWAGKTNFWIRARLVGGDYGHEEVKVIDKPVNKAGETEHVVQRSTANIRAPLVLNSNLSYSICTEVVPTFVLAQDSGTMRDQSDANRTPGAIVEAFVPLALTLGRLTQRIASSEAAKSDCPPDCDCKSLHPLKAETPAGGPTTAATKPPRVNGREIYIGLAATPSEAPVNVLLLVEEEKHTKFAPMTIEALVADRFVPIVVDDATRALGESGVLSMSFAIPPTRTELFGKDNLTWLRLKPKSKETDEWIPTLRGAYLNAAWASATETLTRELLGSSDGAPNLTVFLARPPVLRKTLELRVKEPLGEEEREALLKEDANSVLSAVEGLPGDWVRWKQVTDPDDELATARVYALDEANGEIRFGDGRHGKIPPISQDSIVAFSYGRTEPDPVGGDSVPGNAIAARTALNLISPVQTVETVTAADQAAGGAPPESDDRVLRFGFARLRHRSRAVTAEDLEDLALESSPDIVQARAFVRRSYLRLVIVMRGKDPLPSAAQIRESRRLLLDAAPAALRAPNVLRIEGPGIRRLRIELRLRVETLDHAGQLSTSVKEKLAEFFDTATGGLDKDGWALGANPSEEDIALAISDAPYLESIEDVKLHEITEDGKELPSLEAPGSREIVMLADDPIRIQFETTEVPV